MSYEKLLTHRCDIYHLKIRDKSSGGKFGVPVEGIQEEYYYDDLPDFENVKCYFTEKSQSVVQLDPNANIIQVFNVHFPVTTDIKVSSKIVWEGTTFKSQKPKKIKNHHQEVTVNRSDNL